MVTTSSEFAAVSASVRSQVYLRGSTNIHPSVNSKVKRCIDILGATIGLILTALVVMPITIAIQIDSPGPVFYSQTRCGHRGRYFKIWKFRSMVVNAEALKQQVTNQANGHVFKNDNDPRITRVGQFLRRTSLDELPQFWNVLQGDMSLVGTRPPTVNEVKQYSKHHWRRLEVKPGITGEWQVNGRSQIIDFEAIVQLDLRYLHRWSVMYDLFLIGKTIWVVLSKQGAC
ncbi:sugar transferase [Leptolyngbya sp. FACHB-541]|uniref:sugar transferase n=1 Tax=Leptolyngbya sp. FACHB-541 TaxID=2692810 RepID=UPI00168531F8|nr:sugar transferase [Leptolyngbya sp. FACHB-541]MBD1998864.1 sugar transferase [Leptolyngbya sp. FACHB-541]